MNKIKKLLEIICKESISVKSYRDMLGYYQNSVNEKLEQARDDNIISKYYDTLNSILDLVNKLTKEENELNSCRLGLLQCKNDISQFNEKTYVERINEIKNNVSLIKLDLDKVVL